ncbi:hypothetical protein [Oscillibacter ruminantium]|jgi:hypothetical protein
MPNDEEFFYWASYFCAGPLTGFNKKWRGTVKKGPSIGRVDNF